MLQTLIALAVIAVTQFVKYLQVRDYNSAVTIAVAAVIGMAAGIFNLTIDGITLTWFSGLIAGLDAVGIHTIAKKIGVQS